MSEWGWVALAYGATATVMVAYVGWLLKRIGTARKRFEAQQ